MSKKVSSLRTAPHAATMKRILIVAQLSALVFYLLGLQFLAHTTGGTLFLFNPIGPLLVGLAAVCLVAVIVHELRRRHSLFTFATYTPGQIVFRQGEEGDCAYFVHSGEVEVVREEKGSETVLARLTKGQYFGEMSLIANQPRSATVRAVTNARIAVLGKKNFMLMLSVLPTAQEDILKTMNERAMQQATE